MSNPGTPPMPRPEALKKLAQLRIERLKKEEEEEQWISGEELYTEGSSDEDDSALRTKRKSNEKSSKKSSKNVGSKPKKQVKEENQKTQSHLSPPLVNLTSYSEKHGTEEETILVDAGLENENLSALNDAYEAYCTVIAKVKKLKGFFMDDSNDLSMMKNKISSTFSQKNLTCDKSNTNADICKLLAGDWSFLQERCDVESALTNMKILDLLLEIIDGKQKEVHEKTQNVQLQIRDDLSQLISDEPTDDEVINNINGFLHLGLYAENKDNVKDTENLNTDQNLQVANDKYTQYMGLKFDEYFEHSDSVEFAAVNEILKNENKAHVNFDILSFDENCESEIVQGTDHSFFLTDDEKQRLAVLLDDDCDSQIDEFVVADENANSKGIKKIDEAYTLNQENKLTLEKINEKLKEFHETSHDQMRCDTNTHVIVPDEKGKVPEANEEKLQLHEIDLLLESLNCSTDNMKPLSNLRIKELVKTAMANTENSTSKPFRLSKNLNCEDVNQSEEKNVLLPKLLDAENINELAVETENPTVILEKQSSFHETS